MTENAATTTDDTTDPARQAIRRRVVNRQSRPAPKEKVDVNPDIVLSDMLPLCGSLGQNPELRFTPGGRAVCNLNVAYDVRDRVGTGENTKWISKGTMWVRVNVWGQMAENAAESLNKGDRIVAYGYWTDRDWTDKDGNAQVATEFNARDIGVSVMFATATAHRAARS
jgi:single-strand DNA-binding protein